MLIQLRPSNSSNSFHPRRYCSRTPIRRVTLRRKWLPASAKSLISDTVDLRVDGGTLILVRQLFQGKLYADVKARGESPIFVSVQAGAFHPAQPAAEAANTPHPMEAFDVTLDRSQIRSKPGDLFRESQRSVDLSSADLIVSVGRGIKEKDNLPIVEELAQALGAEIAASRPICDNGWLPMERQVGSSGQTVSPKVYIAIGISGAIQHLVGMKGGENSGCHQQGRECPDIRSSRLWRCRRFI